MPPPSLLTFRFPKKFAKAILAGERFYNASYNRSLRRTMSAFSRDFANKKLTGADAAYRVRRRGGSKNLGGNRIPIAKKAKTAGFKATIEKPNTIKGKTVMMRTRNPALVLRERGGVITPRRGKYLAVKIRTAKGRARLNRRFKATRGRATRRLPFPVNVRRVRIEAKLGLLKHFAGYIGKTMTILFAGHNEATKRWSERLGRAGRPKRAAG